MRNGTRRSLIRWAYVLLACLTLVPLAGAGWHTADLDFTVYLPLVLRNPCTTAGNVIFGCVEQNGVPAAGVPVRLDLLDDGPPRQTIAVAVTDAQGVYAFKNVPTAIFPDSYEVRFENESDPGRLWTWYTPLTHTAGARQALPLMDITNIPLYNPPDGAQVTLPYTFTWGVRQSPFEKYHLLITNSNGSVVFYDGTNHHTGFYSLNGLTAGLQYGVEYRWYLWIDGGVTPLVSAYTFGTSRVTFLPPASVQANAAFINAWVPKLLSRQPVQW